MAFDLNEFRTQIAAPSRTTLFYASLQLPAVDFADLQFRCEATSLPKVTVGKMDLPFLGRKIPHAGDLVYEDWTVKIINEDGNTYRREFERWFALINDPVEGLRDPSFADSHLSYKGVGTVTQLTQAGEPAAVYNIQCYPMELGQIDLNWKENDSYVTFDVRFAIDYWESGTV